QPPAAGQPAGNQTFNEVGTFSKSLNISPNQTVTFNIACQPNQQATFAVKPQFDAKLNIQVYQNGQQVAQDTNGPIKTSFNLTWNSTAANCTVQVLSTDNLVNNCTFSFTQGQGGAFPAAPPAAVQPGVPGVGGVIQKNGPFTDSVSIKPNDNFTY